MAQGLSPRVQVYDKGQGSCYKNPLWPNSYSISVRKPSDVVLEFVGFVTESSNEFRYSASQTKGRGNPWVLGL